MYKKFPFQIEADNEMIICSNFFLSKRRIKIKYEDIDKITGGIFSGLSTKPIFLWSLKQNQQIGFYAHLKNFNYLLKIILQNVNQELYDALLNDLKNIASLNKNPGLTGVSRKS
jgi:hypothetical protein